MILAMPELEQPFRRHIGRCRRGVEAYHASLQVVDAQHGLIQGTFKRAPALSDAQIVEDRRQPIISQVARCDLAADAPAEGTLMGGDPRLHAIESVVTLGEDEGQPHDRRLAETQSLPITIGREVFVQEFSHAHVLEVHKDGWYVVDAFVGCCNSCAHPTSLTQISFSRENSHEMSEYKNRLCQLHRLYGWTP
jgi:hypothetical protein